MAQACQVCNHPKRINIDRQIVAGSSLSKISKEYGVSYGSLYGHAQNHITRQLATAMQKKEMTESMDLLGRIETLLARAEKIFHRNYDKGKDGLALKALGESRSTIELLAKIAAYLHEARAMELQQQAKQEETLDLSMLNDRELSIFSKLIRKINKKDPAIVVLPDKTRPRESFIPDGPTDPAVDSEDPIPTDPAEEGSSMRRTKRPAFSDPVDTTAPADEEESLHPLRVGPLTYPTIPSSDRKPRF